MGGQYTITKLLRDDEIQYYKDIIDGKPAKLHTDEIIGGYTPPSLNECIGIFFVTVVLALILIFLETNAYTTQEQLMYVTYITAVLGIGFAIFLNDYLDGKRAEKMCPGINKALGYEPMSCGFAIILGILLCLWLVLLALVCYKCQQEAEMMARIMEKRASRAR